MENPAAECSRIYEFCVGPAHDTNATVKLRLRKAVYDLQHSVLRASGVEMIQHVQDTQRRRLAFVWRLLDSRGAVKGRR